MKDGETTLWQTIKFRQFPQHDIFTTKFNATVSYYLWGWFTYAIYEDADFNKLANKVSQRQSMTDDEIITLRDKILNAQKSKHLELLMRDEALAMHDYKTCGYAASFAKDTKKVLELFEELFEEPELQTAKT